MIIKSIRCVNFRDFEDVAFEFGAVNYIEGENYKGKTSISEAIVALLLGTTITGSPQVTDLIRHYGKPNGAKKFELTGIIEVPSIEGDVMVEHEIYRSRDSRKTTLQIDGNPATQAEIDRFIGAKDRFLTVFTQFYFSGLSNPAAREMLIGLTKRPKPDEIIKRIPEHAERLTYPSSKDPDVIIVLPELRDPESFAKSIRADIKANETEMSKIDGRVQVYQEQLRAEAPVVPDFDLSALEALRAELSDLQSGETLLKTREKESEIGRLRRELQSIKLQDVPNAPHSLGEPCPMCLRPLDESSLDTLLAHHHDVVEEIEDSNADKLVEQVTLQERIDTLTDEIQDLGQVDDTRIRELTEEIRDLEKIEYDVTAGKAKLEQHERAVENAAANINKAENERAELERETFELAEKLKAVAAFRQELVKVQVGSIQQHLDRVGIELFKVTQDGEIKDDFVLTYDGKDYRILSMSERIRVGLEIASLFNTVLGLDFPVFIDNAESITHYERPKASQMFLAKVVEGADLKLEVEAE